MNIANLSDKMHQVIIIKNITDKEQCFRIESRPQGVILDAGKTINAKVSDLLTLLNGDPFLYGVDTLGTFATLKIENDDVREALGFIERDDNGKITKDQLLLDEKTFISEIKKNSSQKACGELAVLLSGLSFGNKIMLQRFIRENRDKIDTITAKNMATIEEAISV